MENIQSARHKMIKSLKEEANANRTLSQKVADVITNASGSMTFLLLNFALFFVWIIINLDLIPFIKAFDPYPFGLLTMAVSLEAIILAVIVLISQNRSSEIDEIREEIDLHIDIITEQEVTKIMAMLSALLEKNGFEVKDDEKLKEMLQPVNIEKIKEFLEKKNK